MAGFEQYIVCWIQKLGNLRQKFVLKIEIANGRPALNNRTLFHCLKTLGLFSLKTQQLHAADPSPCRHSNNYLREVFRDTETNKICRNKNLIEVCDPDILLVL